jgi:hypothetical protein
LCGALCRIGGSETEDDFLIRPQLFHDLASL